MRFSKLIFIFSFTLLSVNLSHAFAASCDSINPKFTGSVWDDFNSALGSISTSASQAKTAADALAVSQLIQFRWSRIQTTATSLSAALPHLNCLTSIKAPEKSSTTGTPYKPDPAVTSANTFSAKMISSYHGFKASGNKIMTLNPETTTVMKQLVTIHPLPSSGPLKKSGSN